MKQTRITVVLAVAAVALPSWLAKPARAQCGDLKDSERARLTEYVQSRYKVPPATHLSLFDVSLVGSTCYRKLEFKSGDQRRQLALYLSPDLRFLTRDLLDSTVDPVEEARQKEETLATGLTQGPFPVRGPANALATLTVFSDFECPYCARLYTMLKESILPREKDDVRLVFRYLPLPMHPWARAAAEAAACAQQQKDDYFWDLHDFIFEHQRDLTPANLIDKLGAAAKDLPGFDQAKFQSCVAGKRAAARVDQDVAFAMQNGIEATPTLFINGHRLESVANPEQILTFIRQLGEPVRAAAAAARQ